MNTVTNGKSMLAFCSIAFAVLWPSLAAAQETPRPLTIADCPAGYTLGIQDTAEPQPITKNETQTYNPTSNTAQTNTGFNENEAPRAYVTGCIPPAPQQPK